MDCRRIRDLLPGFALGDLDAEPAQAVREHLEGCPGCRAESLSLGSASEALRAAGSLPGSERRREAAVAAMGKAHDEEAERRLFPRRRARRGVWVAAAFLGAAAAGALWGIRLLADRPAVFRAVEVAGRADLFRSAEGRWLPLAAGGHWEPGDRLVTPPGAFVRFEIRAPGRGEGAGELCVDGDTSVARIGGSRIALDRGRLFLDLRERLPSGGLSLSDTANNRVDLAWGCLEAGLREVRAVVAVWRESREGRASGAPGGLRPDVARRLVARVMAGEALLTGARGRVLPAGAGQEGGFDLGGNPETRGAQGPADPAWWRRND